MTTPTFNPISTAFNTVRLYTQFDPYYYTVDNRPLNDILNNVTTLSNGVDASRMSTLLNALNSDIVDSTENGIASNFMLGLFPYSPTNLTIGIGLGIVYVPLAINNSISQVVLKKGVLQEPAELSYTAPGTLGQSVVYNVEVRYADVSASTVGYNFINDANSTQFDTCLDGVLEIQLVQGTPAATGSEAAPSVTSGWIPLYSFHVAYGASTYSKIYAHSNAPKLYKGSGLNKSLALSIPASGGGTSVTTLDPIPAFELTEGSDESLTSVIVVGGEMVNSYRDIKFDVTYTSSTNSGNFAVALGYCVVKEGETMSGITFTYSNPYETLAAPATANYLKTATMTCKVPGEKLQDAKLLVLNLVRLSSTQTGVDTSTGNMLVTGLVAKQV